MQAQAVQRLGARLRNRFRESTQLSDICFAVFFIAKWLLVKETFMHNYCWTTLIILALFDSLCLSQNVYHWSSSTSSSFDYQILELFCYSCNSILYLFVSLFLISYSDLFSSLESMEFWMNWKICNGCFAIQMPSSMIKAPMKSIFQPQFHVRPWDLETHNFPAIWKYE